MKKYVYYTANFCAEIEFETPEDEEDAISDIDIPEGGKHNSVYQRKSFWVYETEDA